MTDVTLDLPAGRDTTPAVPLRNIAAVAAGNALEFYAFLTYSFFAVQIGHAFFPGKNEDLKVLLATIVFGMGFVTRPIGAFVIGRLGDRVGRKPAMVLSFGLMGAAILGVALTPPFSVIGWAAPVLFLSLRLVQGFALGGEVGPATAYLIEVAPPMKRGLYTSIQFATQDLAVLVAGIVGFVLAHTLSPSVYDAWGWRIAFLLATTVIPFALLIRRRLPESLEAGKKADAAETHAPVWQLAILGFVMLASVTITNYVLDYMTTFAENTLHLAADVALSATIVVGLGGVTFDLITGILSDRVGRKPIMLASGIVYLLAVFPVFYAIVHVKSVAVLLVGTGLLSCLQALYATPIIISITEGLPARIRAGALSLIYAFGISVFGGATQPITKALIDLTHNPLAPAAFMATGLFCAIIAMFFVRETAPVKTGPRP
ncbi:MAG TPA: MFS transporter [Rhizomicrobium sp.]|nr:MFS transporter [Rhizomicrobium sp.]